jgi:hypothetical protein
VERRDKLVVPGEPLAVIPVHEGDAVTALRVADVADDSRKVALEVRVDRAVDFV